MNKNKVLLLLSGVKKTDTDNSQLWWLNPFLKFGTIVLGLFGIKLTCPIWDDESSPKIASN